jgi:hypothetical protein
MQSAAAQRLFCLMAALLLLALVRAEEGSVELSGRPPGRSVLRPVALGLQVPADPRVRLIEGRYPLVETERLRESAAAAAGALRALMRTIGLP